MIAAAAEALLAANRLLGGAQPIAVARAVACKATALSLAWHVSTLPPIAARGWRGYAQAQSAHAIHAQRVVADCSMNRSQTCVTVCVAAAEVAAGGLCAALALGHAAHLVDHGHRCILNSGAAPSKPTASPSPVNHDHSLSAALRVALL